MTPTPGTLPHILTECVDLQPARSRVLRLWVEYLKENPVYFPVVQKYTESSDKQQFVQFLLDCTVLSDVITLRQKFGLAVHDSLLYLTRSFCFSIHKYRLKLLGKWNVK